MMFNQFAGQSLAVTNLSQIKSIADTLQLRKALTITGATDVATFTGGDALRLESLDTALKSVVQDFSHLAFYNKVNKITAGAYVHQWIENYAIGGYLGGTQNTPTGSASLVNGEYARRTVSLSTFSTRRQVPYLQDIQRTAAPLLALEQVNGIKQILSDIEYLSFEGNSAVSPREFDGLAVTIADNANNVINMDGAPLNSGAPFLEAAGAVAGYGSFGFADNVYWNYAVQRDMDMGLESTYRIPLAGNPQSYMIGSPVTGISTIQGPIMANWDVFIRDETMQAPFEVANSALATANAAYAPQAVTTAATTGTAANRFTSTRAGNYYYAASGIAPDGSQSAIVKDSVQAIATGEKVTVSITASVANGEVGYVIYRSKQAGTNTTADYREVCRVAKAAGGTTTYVDENLSIPGSTKAYVLSMSPIQDALTYASLLDPIQFPLAAVDAPVIPFLVMASGALCNTKPKQHALIKNIITTNQVWRPFTAE